MKVAPGLTQARRGIWFECSDFKWRSDARIAIRPGLKNSSREGSSIAPECAVKNNFSCQEIRLLLKPQATELHQYC